MLSCSSRLSQIAQGSSNAHACLSSPKLSSRSRSETQGVPHKASDAFKGCMSVIRSKERLFAALSGPTSSAQTYEDFLSQQGNENLSAVLLAFKVLALWWDAEILNVTPDSSDKDRHAQVIETGMKLMDAKCEYWAGCSQRDRWRNQWSCLARFAWPARCCTLLCWS